MPLNSDMQNNTTNAILDFKKTTSKYWNWSRNFHVNSSKKNTPFTHKIYTNHPSTHQFVNGKQASGHWPTHIPYQYPHPDVTLSEYQLPANTHPPNHPPKQASKDYPAMLTSL